MKTETLPAAPAATPPKAAPAAKNTPAPKPAKKTAAKAAPAKAVTKKLPSWSPTCTAKQFGKDECQCANCAKARLS